MSATYWVLKRFGVILALFYLAVMGVLVFSRYRSGMTTPERLSVFYPAGRVYPRTAKNGLIRLVYGFPPAGDDAAGETGSVEILAYGDAGATIRLDGGNRVSATADDLVRRLANTAPLESGRERLEGLFNRLLGLHLEFMRGVEEMLGGAGRDGWLRQILSKAAISAMYLGAVLLAWRLLVRVDRLSGGEAGHSLTYGLFAVWPAAVILVSFAGINVVHVARHLPASWHFMHWHATAGWAAMFAWPAALILLSLLDILRSLASFDFPRALGHAGVLAAGILSIPLVALGVLFAVLAAGMYLCFRIGRRTLLPASWRNRLGGIIGRK